LRGVEQARGGVAVHQDLAGDEPHVERRRFLEQNRGGHRVHGAEHARGRDPVAQVLAQVGARDRSRVVGICESLFRGERVAGKPVEQRLAAGADDRQLRIVDVGVDEARGDQGVGVMRDRRARRQARKDIAGRSAIDDASAFHGDDRVRLVAAGRRDSIDKRIAAERDKPGAY